MKYQVLTTVTKRIIFFLGVMSCSLVDMCRYDILYEVPVFSFGTKQP